LGRRAVAASSATTAATWGADSARLPVGAGRRHIIGHDTASDATSPACASSPAG
jgi:hypothetical protein